MATSKPAQKKRAPAITIERLIPGSFYQSIYPGGFTDATTRIHIPGPKAQVDENTKKIIKFSSLAAPVQIPHWKIVSERKDMDGKEIVEHQVDFDANDNQPLHIGLEMALRTGIISHVSDDDMEELYPETWDNRSEDLIYQRDVTAVPFKDLMASFREEQAAKAQLAEAREKATANSAKAK